MIYSQYMCKLVTRASLFIRAGGGVSSVPATAIFGHLVIFVIAHFRRWRFYKFVVNSYTRFIIRTIFSHYVKISFANHWKELFKTALLCDNVYYAFKKIGSNF